MKGGDGVIVENQNIEVKVTCRNIKHYEGLGYKNLKLGDVLLINVEDLTNGSKIKVDVRCDYCGDIIKVAYRDYVGYKFDKYSCKHCRQRKTSEYNLSQRREDLYQRALSFCIEKGYKLITDKSDIYNSESRVLYECPKHGVHETKIYTLIDRHGCIDCANEENHKRMRKNIEDVYSDFKKYGGILLNKEDYLGWNYKNLKVVCKECGDIFITSYCAFMQHEGQLCSKCASNISRGEYAIKKYLESLNIDFCMQFRFDDCKNIIPLPFDFYLPNYNICIEYDGEGRYKPINRGGVSDIEAKKILDEIKNRDNIKTSYCNQNRIKLIRIPYWEFDNIDNILNRELFTQRYSLIS